jgi:hypothetical protein
VRLWIERKRFRITRIEWVFPRSFMFGWHFGRNPVNGQRFGCIGFGFWNLDIQLPPYLNNQLPEDK